MSLEWVAVGTLAVTAIAWDIRTRRVPNVVTIGAAALGVAFSVAHLGIEGITSSVLGWVTGLALFFPLFAVGGMGAGDVKLLAAFGAWLGPIGAFWAAMWAALVGGALAIAVGIARGYLGQALRNVGAVAATWWAVGPSAVAGMTLRDSRSPRLAYAIPIAAGALITLWRMER